MRLSLSTGSLYAYPLRTTFRLAKEAGFDGVELVVGPETLLRSTSVIRRLARTYEQSVFSVHPPLLRLPGYRNPHRSIVKLIDVAQRTGASLVVVHPPSVTAWQHPQAEAFLRALDVAQRRLAEGPVRIALENPTPLAHGRRLLSQPQTLHAFAEARDLDLVLDTAHASSLRCPLQHVYKQLGDRLVNVHLSDVSESCRLPNVLGVHALLRRHQFPGEGRLPLADLVRRMLADGYQGLVTMELSPLTVRAWSPTAVQRRLAGAVTWMREALDTPIQEANGESPVTVRPLM